MLLRKAHLSVSALIGPSSRVIMTSNCPTFLWITEKWNVCLVAQSCQTFWDPMDCSLPGSSVHGILQARTLEWVAMPSSRASSQPRDQTQVSRIARRFLESEPPGKPEKWNIACHISKQGCHSYRWLQLSNISQWALRALKKEKNTCPLRYVRLQSLPTVSSKGAQDVKHRVLAR